MASFLHKRISHCTSAGRQDRNQDQRTTAKEFSSGSFMSNIGPKEVKSSREDKTSCFGKKDMAGFNGVIPWMDKVWKSMTRSLLNKASSKGRSSDQALEVCSERVFFEKRASSKSTPESNLHLGTPHDDAILYHLCRHSVSRIWALEGVESKEFSVGIFLYQPLKNSNLAHGLKAGVKKGNLQKKSTLGFARVQGEPPLILSETLHEEGLPKSAETVHSVEPLLQLQSTSFLDLIPGQRANAIPDKEKLSSVQDFFLYAEAEGKRVFEEIDMDKDGKVSADDIRAVMHKMKLPSSYATNFMHAKHNHWPMKSIGWTHFSSLMQEKEPMMIQLFNSLGVSKHGTLQRAHVKNLLKEHSFSDSEATITAMMKALGGEGDSIKYGQFRRFMLLVPTEQLKSDPWSVWFRAASLGGEPKVAKGSVLNHVNLLSSGFVRQLEVAKSKVVSPDLPRVEEVSEFIRTSVKHVIHEPLTRMRVDVLKIGG